MRFQKGDIVRISKDSWYFDGYYDPHNEDDDHSNPCAKINGILVNELTISVEWDNGYSNDYCKEDLKLVRRG